jgi:AcrR family transcriptional regulator
MTKNRSIPGCRRDRARAEERRAICEEALLHAAERLLVDAGHAGIATRRLAQEAGVNHGLVHYHFGCQRARWRRLGRPGRRA